MTPCMIDVKFLKNDDSKIFAKKIVFSGILPNLKPFTKEITIPYPNNEIYENDDNDTSNGFGNLEIQRAEQEITKSLSLFDIILVKNELQKKYFLNCFRNSYKIVNLHKLIEE
jgi:hypothetical protein